MSATNELPNSMGDSPTNTSNSPADSDSLPEQRHAGKVGYGPNFHAGPTLGDKIIGLKEEIAGKLTRNQERVSHGREILTGEERWKKLTGADEQNPFQNADQDDSEKSTGSQLNASVDQGANKAKEGQEDGDS